MGALGLLRFAVAEEEFQDTPLLSSIWQAVSSKDNEAIDRLFDSTNFAATARASDGRGPVFWAFEYNNAYALGSLMVAGVDVESADEDLAGATAVGLCEENPDCNKEALLTEAKGLMEDIKKRKEERAMGSDDLEDDSDFDVDDSSGAAKEEDDE